MCQAPQTINRFIVSPSPRGFFSLSFLCNISRSSPRWLGGQGWLVSTSLGVWNALNLIHSRGPDIQHCTADSPDVIGSQGNLQLSQDLGGFLNSSSEFLQKKIENKEKKARDVNIPRDSFRDCKSTHGSFGWSKLFPERPEKRKSQTQPQTAKNMWTGSFKWECQVPVTPFTWRELGGGELPTH